jgi:RNA polymerase sigma-70 factor (ECF subfamily)
LQASETWAQKGLPENPVAWLYTVAKNKARNHLKRDAVFREKIVPEFGTEEASEAFIDLSDRNITDSQLQMIFAVCHPAIPAEAQIGMALRILCGFGIQEIADAFLTNKETIQKRLFRAKEKLRTEGIEIAFPGPEEIDRRLSAVLTTLYLLFSEGYYSSGQDTLIRRELCFEAMRLTHLLLENTATDKPAVNALFALMSYQASRFAARTDSEGATVLYDDQDETLWDEQLIAQGTYFLNRAANGTEITKYHLEAAIAWCHTQKSGTPQKWENILQHYNQLLIIEYSPIAALNRTYALSRVKGKAAAIPEAEKLGLDGNCVYHSLLGELYSGIDNQQAVAHFQKALRLARNASEKAIITRRLNAH